jgi:renalase
VADIADEAPEVAVAVIGAGVAGLLCARTLAEHGVPVTIFEKSRGLGGRCATRRIDAWQFDHGAQYFTVRDPRLAPLVERWRLQGLIALWQGTLAVREKGQWQPAKRGVHRWVAVPGMSALGAHLAEKLDVRRNTMVERIERAGDRWRLMSDSGDDLGSFSVVLVCVPSPQALHLLTPVAPALAQLAAAAVMHPIWATMLALPDRPGVTWDGAFLNDDETLSWISRNASKPGRDAGEAWVLHATREWTLRHLEESTDSVSEMMTTAFQHATGCTTRPVHAVSHRWRYALPDPVVAAPALYDAALGLGAAGDWCGGARVEGALLSGIALAEHVLGGANVVHA